MKAAICIDTLEDAGTIPERVELCASFGFRAVEMWGWRDKDVPALEAALERTGVSMVNMSAHRRGSPIAAADRQTFLDEVADTVAVARPLGCPTLMVLSNELGEGGRVVDAFDAIPATDKRDSFISALRAAVEQLPPDMRLVLEHLNTEVDHPGNFLTSLAGAREIVDAVADERVGILADLYHLAVGGTDPMAAIREFAPWFGHVHIAGLPNRNEPGAPGSDETDWAAVLRALHAAGYDGAVGFEFFPAEGSLLALDRIRRLWESL